MSHTILTLPGLNSSGAGHWQTLWEEKLPHVVRVQQSEWDTPTRAEWVATLDAAIQAAPTPVVLVAHSLGCALVAWWASEHGHAAHADKVIGALLVAPADVEQSGFPQDVVGFAPIPRLRLPFKSIVVASSDDPWCELPKAKMLAADWHARFHDIGARGHINAASNLGDWPQGRDFLIELVEQN
jgi:predicted alpha/beta hydrolase family esterase